MDFKIRAFGACMIGGFPHRYGDSGFHLATERLRQETQHNIIPSIYTLGGFPVPRALKHLRSRCLAVQPDIVVLQFGSCDLAVPVRTKHHHYQAAAVQQKACAIPANILHQLRWRARGLVGDLLRLKPVTPPEVYLETLHQMIRTIAAQPAIPVVMSPFILGAQRSNRIARQCVPRLREVVAAVPTAHYVDVYSALDQYPRREILLHDGAHLTLKGQAIVGERLFAVLAEIIGDKTNHRPAPDDGQRLGRLGFSPKT